MKRKRRNISGIRFKQLREAQNLDLMEISAALDIDYGILIDRTNLGRIENGTRAVTDIELVVFAHYFQVPIESLLWEPGRDPEEVGELLKKVQVRRATRRRSSDETS